MQRQLIGGRRGAFKPEPYGWLSHLAADGCEVWRLLLSWPIFKAIAMKKVRDQAAAIYDDAPDNPALSDVVERNIRTILKLKARSAAQRSIQERLADAITNLSGRMSFVYLHAVWFAAWLLLNTGWFGVKPFDPYPYGLLTMIVSLEAIFLSTFVLISQNRLGEESDKRADLDLHIGLLAEAELTRVLKMLRAIHEKLGIEGDGPDEQADLELPARPEDVLGEIDRLRKRR